MNRIVIAVCTYNRLDGLKNALRSLDGQQLSSLSDERILLAVVDNSATASARGICEAYRQQGRFALRYVHQPQKGLVHARNSCLAAAEEEGASHILFLDDDEAAGPKWAETLLARLAASGAAAAVGPVFPIFERPPPSWLPMHRYVNRVRETGGFVEDGHTCNAVIAMDAIRSGGLRFDLRFNETGGEDTEFFQSLQRGGHRIAWAEDAPVFEFVPVPRMRPDWLFRRWYRTGIVEAQLAQGPEPSFAGRLANIAQGLARIGAGGAGILYNFVVHAWRNPDRLVASCYTFCRGAGYVSGALGISYREYSQPNYR